MTADDDAERIVGIHHRGLASGISADHRGPSLSFQLKLGRQRKEPAFPFFSFALGFVKLACMHHKPQRLIWSIKRRLGVLLASFGVGSKKRDSSLFLSLPTIHAEYYVLIVCVCDDDAAF